MEHGRTCSVVCWNMGVAQSADGRHRTRARLHSMRAMWGGCAVGRAHAAAARYACIHCGQACRGAGGKGGHRAGLHSMRAMWGGLRGGQGARRCLEGVHPLG